MKLDIEEVREKLKEAEEIAKAKRIPFFAAIPTENSEDKTKYEYFHATPYYAGVKLKDDYISPMLLVINGFGLQKAKPSDVEGLLSKAKKT